MVCLSHRESRFGGGRYGLLLGALCLMLALSGSLVPVAAEQTGSPVDVSELRQAALQRVFRLLRENYIRSEEITEETVNRAALDGLLRRFGSNAELVEEQDEGESDESIAGGMPTVFDRLSGKIAYLRMSLADRVPEAGELTEAIEGAAWFLIDLRCPDGCEDFGKAARFLSCFVPGGEELFRMKRTGEFSGEIFRSQEGEGKVAGIPQVVLLVDGDTSPAAEVVAGWFALRGEALVAGEPTGGRTVRFARVAIAQGVCLRFAEAEVVFPGGEALGGRGLRPAVSVRSLPGSKQAAFSAARDRGVGATISQQQRPQLNEAALVSGIDPELAEQSEGISTALVESVQDSALRQLVDLLVAVDHLQIRRPSRQGTRSARPVRSSVDTEGSAADQEQDQDG